MLTVKQVVNNISEITRMIFSKSELKEIEKKLKELECSK